MERMVIDAVRGSPTVAPSRTAHFQSKGRCQTPIRRAPSDSSETESEGEGTSATERQPDSSSEDTGESSYYEDSDSATESDLITKSFKRVSVPLTKGSGSTQISSGQQQTETDTSEFSSQDTTLQEIRERAQPTGGISSKAKRRKGDRRPTRRGVPKREEFFSKIGWTRSFISGPADPVHNPLMVWCHVCKKNFSIKSKPHMRSSGITAPAPFTPRSTLAL